MLAIVPQIAGESFPFVILFHSFSDAAGRRYKPNNTMSNLSPFLKHPNRNPITKYFLFEFNVRIV
jgi:hypothetical protein